MIDPPTRSWINGVLDDLEANLKDRRMIDPKRLESASFEVITNHFVCFTSLLKSINPLLLFGADETMMSCNKTGKAVIPEKIKQLLEKDFPQMPHVSGMMCNNVLGVPLPPFIILPNLKKLPNELLPLVSSGQIWVASLANGYMTKELFLIWFSISLDLFNLLTRHLTGLKAFRCRTIEQFRKNSFVFIEKTKHANKFVSIFENLEKTKTSKQIWKI